MRLRARVEGGAGAADRVDDGSRVEGLQEGFQRGYGGADKGEVENGFGEDLWNDAGVGRVGVM